MIMSNTKKAIKIGVLLDLVKTSFISFAHWLKKFICIFFPNSFHSWKKSKIIFSHQNFFVENSYFLPLQSMYQQQDWRSFDCKWSSILPKYALIQSLFIFFTSVRPFYPQRILMTTSDGLGTKNWVSGFLYRGEILILFHIHIQLQKIYQWSPSCAV